MAGRDSDESRPFLDEEVAVFKKSRGTPQWLKIFPWMLAAASWSLTIFLLLSPRSPALPYEAPLIPEPNLAEQNTCHCEPQTQPTFWPTDLDSMKPVVEYETIEYTGSLLYNTTSQRVYRNVSVDDIQFVGPPKPEIDAAWDKLLKDEWPVLTDEEAEPFLPELRRLPNDNRYHFEPDMFHSLHCLNALRQALDKDYYRKLPEFKAHDVSQFLKQDDFDRIHMDHCIDRIRQALQCHGDLSPSPMYSWDGFILALGRGSQHTCRKWQPIRDWATNRTRYYREQSQNAEKAKAGEKHE